MPAYTDNIESGTIVDYDKDPIGHAVGRISSLIECSEESVFVKNVKHAAEVLESSLERYSLDEICVGFNGGKDCTALLHLFYAMVKRKFPNERKKIKALYIRRGQPFPEVELFIKSCVERYNLELLNFNGRIKESLAEMKISHPEIKAVVMGTRRSDPYSNHLESFSITDKDWPQFMRVNPILDWSFSDVWTFLRTLCLEYCGLYDRGYTSLGSMENTHPNPDLKQVDDRGIITYRPAYLLDDGQSERAGRN